MTSPDSEVDGGWLHLNGIILVISGIDLHCHWPHVPVLKCGGSEGNITNELSSTFPLPWLQFLMLYIALFSAPTLFTTH